MLLARGYNCSPAFLALFGHARQKKTTQALKARCSKDLGKVPSDFSLTRMYTEDWKTELYMLKTVVVKGGVAPYWEGRCRPMLSTDRI